MNKGFTLIEVLITMAILSGVVIVISFFGLDILDFGNFLGENLGATEELQQALVAASSEIRSMSSSDTGTYKLASATATSLVFFSDVDGDGTHDRVRYFLDGTTLKKGIVKPSGSPVTYDLATETVREVVHNVLVGSDIFMYYNQDYDGTTQALVSPFSPSSVRVIRIQMTVDPSPQDLTGRSTLSVLAKIRSI